MTQILPDTAGFFLLLFQFNKKYEFHIEKKYELQLGACSFWLASPLQDVLSINWHNQCNQSGTSIGLCLYVKNHHWMVLTSLSSSDLFAENTEREKLISTYQIVLNGFPVSMAKTDRSQHLFLHWLLGYANWYPDWDTQPQPPRPRPPRPPVPSDVPPAQHPRPSCDQYCLSVLILRPLFLILSVGAVLLVQKQFPHVYFYE